MHNNQFIDDQQLRVLLGHAEFKFMLYIIIINYNNSIHLLCKLPTKIFEKTTFLNIFT